MLAEAQLGLIGEVPAEALLDLIDEVPAEARLGLFGKALAEAQLDHLVEALAEALVELLREVLVEVRLGLQVGTIVVAIQEALVLYVGQGLLHEEVCPEVFPLMDLPNALEGAVVLVNDTLMLGDTELLLLIALLLDHTALAESTVTGISCFFFN